MQALTRDQIRVVLFEILKELRDDWHRSTEVTEQTGLFRDLGFESIDAVALGSELEEYFDRSLPFAEFLTRAREQNWTDITVGQLLTFLAGSLNEDTAPVLKNKGTAAANL